MAETFDWLKPSTLWEQGGADMRRRSFFRPALHEFATDKFMEEFLASAAAASPRAFRASLARPAAGRETLKLFQPVHGNFYLTSASLCCRVPGFPDREVRTGEGESVFFVLRKSAGGVEYAWNTGGESPGWQPLAGRAQTVAAGEERLPLFQTPTAAGRNVFFGYVPVASRETYAAAAGSPDSPIDSSAKDLRLEELCARFTEPLDPALSAPAFGPVGARADEATQRRITVYLLLDLWEYLDAYLPEVAAALRDGTTSTLTGKKRDLADYLKAQKLGVTTLYLADALRRAAQKQSDLSGPGDLSLAQLEALGFDSRYDLLSNPLAPAVFGTTGLEKMVGDALASEPAAAAPPVPVPKVEPKAGETFVLRYVYERAQCDPPHLYVSRPTRAFELAPFFDPEAPARDIRVGLPVDVSIAGLRKFKKNVAFMMSKELRNKLEAVSGKEKDILDGDKPGPEGGFELGHICSFSLPIITLCAFILLMIIVILLNIVFWWIPLLRICFPLKLKAK